MYIAKGRLLIRVAQTCQSFCATPLYILLMRYCPIDETLICGCLLVNYDVLKNRIIYIDQSILVHNVQRINLLMKLYFI